MKQTRKYSGACEIATLPHQTQEDLYKQLNELGWFWNSKNQKWERDDRLANPPSRHIKVRVWAATEKVSLAADLLIEQFEPCGLRLIERSEPYVCRSPKQGESRIYLSFMDEDADKNNHISSDQESRQLQQ